MRRMDRAGPAATFLAAVLGLGLAPADGTSQTPQEKAKSLARAANVMVEEGRLDQALPLFVKAYELDPAPALAYNIGRIHDKRGDLKQAREWYERYVATEADPQKLAKGRSRLDAVLDRIPGRLFVESDPPGATIEVDGKPVIAGRTIELKRGSHAVAARLDRYQPAKRDVDVPAGGDTRVKIELRPLPGNLVVRCAVDGARATVDGAEPRRTPAEPWVLAPGRHVVEVVADGYERAVEVVQVQPGATTSVTVAPKPTPRSVAPVAKAAPAASPLASPPPPAVSKRVSRPHSPWQWVAIGAGAALVVGGGLLTHFANVDRARVDDATVWSDGTIKRSSVTRSEALSLSAEADRKMDASIALYAIGGAAVVTGIVLWLTEPAGSQPGRADSGPGRLAGVGAAPFGDGAALSLSGWF